MTTPIIHITVGVFEAGVTEDNRQDFDEALEVTVRRIQGLCDRLEHRYPDFDFEAHVDDD